MSSGNKYGSEKEVQAITVNIKEDRILAKMLQTLDLEEHYAIQLIALEHRDVKLRQRRLRSRVNRIKSYLTATEIADLRSLEEQGKLCSPYSNRSINIASSMRIASAAKRLKIGHDPDVIENATRPKMGRLRPTLSAPPLRRSKSLNLNPLTEKSSKNESKLSLPEAFKSEASIIEGLPGRPRLHKIRPETSHQYTKSKMRLPARRPHTAVGYSSHEEAEREARMAFSAATPQPPTRSSIRPSSTFSDRSISENVAKHRAQEKRMDMLYEESLNFLRWDDRRREFLQKINKWVDEG